MELLEKTRKINKLLQRGEKVEYNAIARLLRDVIGANIYIVAVSYTHLTLPTN